jgi:beta-barrel assembly-enhancing protease
LKIVVFCRSLFYASLFLSLNALFCACGHAQAANAELQLPSLGENSAGLISPSEEYALGQELIRLYRASLPTSQDPFLEAYLAELLQRVSTYSELQDKRLELIVLDSPTLNAFAAPGGIVGVNTGTFLTAQNEHQLASILSHELAHLSQRHYARRLQQQKSTSTIGLAALLASLMVVAAGNSDAGIAAIPAIQAAAIESSLRFSRDMEIEADRIGMQTLVYAGFDPYSMPGMFEQMLKATRYRSKVPEFLLTHPVTESRIADSSSRAQKFPQKHVEYDKNYQLMRARVMLRFENNAAQAVKRFANEIDVYQTMSPLTANYGLVMARTQMGDLQGARDALVRLRTLTDNPAILAIAEADIAAKEQNWDAATATLQSTLTQQPNNHPLNVRLAEILMEAGRYSQCEALLVEHVKRPPDNSYVWYLLAEVHGLAGHILDVHKARAEYFILKGIYGKAEIQLRNALRLIDEKDFQSRAKIEQRLLDVRQLQESSRLN